VVRVVVAYIRRSREGGNPVIPAKAGIQSVVIPAKAGIQSVVVPAKAGIHSFLDTRLRGYDEVDTGLRRYDEFNIRGYDEAGINQSFPSIARWRG
jgi:hypothetical protein